jgi:hypothetical protein
MTASLLMPQFSPEDHAFISSLKPVAFHESLARRAPIFLFFLDLRLAIRGTRNVAGNLDHYVVGFCGMSGFAKPSGNIFPSQQTIEPSVYLTFRRLAKTSPLVLLTQKERSRPKKELRVGMKPFSEGCLATALVEKDTVRVALFGETFANGFRRKVSSVAASVIEPLPSGSCR